MSIKTLKYKVIEILRDIPESRNCDQYLTIAIWERFYGDEIISINGKNHIQLSSLLFLPREDNIKRHRAIIQNEKGMYLPTRLEVVKKRKMNEEDWREYLKGSNN